MNFALLQTSSQASNKINSWLLLTHCSMKEVHTWGIPPFLFYWKVCCKAVRLKGELTFLQNNVLTLVSVASAWKILTFHCLTKTSNKNKLNSGRRATGRTERWKADFLQDLKYEYIRHCWARHTRCWEGKGLVLCNFSMDGISISCPQNADMS